MSADPVNSSDEAIHAAAVALANSAKLPGWMQLSALGRDMTPIAQRAVEAAYPVIAAAVRAEAVADERRRNLEVNAASESLMRYAADVYRHLRMDTPEDQETHAKVIAMLDRGADAFATRAAGSVPVATPPAEPAATRLWPCEHGERGWHRTDDNRHCLGGAAPSQPVTCEHGKTGWHLYVDRRSPISGTRQCPGPVSVPKESSE